MTRERRWTPALLAAPFVLYTVFVAGPALYTFWLSTSDWKLLRPQHQFVGLRNFATLLGDSEFWASLRITLWWTVVGVAASVVLGFLLALALSRLTRFSRLAKSMFFLPLSLSLVVVGFAWSWVYRRDDGLISVLLGLLGREDLARAWLSEESTALWAVILAWLWQQVPLSMVVYLAGLTAVPGELLEAATVDGASFWRRVRHVVIPAVRPSTAVVVSLALINALRSFDIVYVMTKGGPYDSTQTLALMSYEQAFKRYDFGYGSAVSVALFVVTVLVIGGFTHVSGRGDR
ncbi:MAG: sugar ABC transporter permease [Kineosporiaceae bacterium]|nr:sugar ABC transporter permease [Kineosporiaceae bacterium]